MGRLTEIFIGALLVSMVLGELSGPLNLKKELPKKAAAETNAEDESPADSPMDNNVPKDDNELLKELETVEKRMKDFISSMKDMGSSGGPLTVVKPPDLSKGENSESEESDKMSEVDSDNVAPAAILENMQKWMKMLSDLGQELGAQSSDEIEDNAEEALEMLLPLPEEPVVELTPEEIEIEEIYQSGLSQLNKSRGDKKLGYNLINQAAERGHKEAQIKIAWGRLFGNHIEHNVELAKNTFEALSELGNADAHTGLGLLYASGIGVNVSQARALIHLTMGALGENIWAQMALGYRHWAGVTVPIACEKALDFYRKAATKVASEVSLGGGAAVHRIRLLDEQENSGYSSGILYSDLIEYYQLMAEKGDIQTQVGLGQLHYQGGRGVTLDMEKAMHYFKQAANAGNAEAMAYLGKIHLQGSDTIEADNETALRYFRKAADLNNPVGQSGLGLMYLHGRGVQKDTNQALKYFKLAADQGWVDGQLQLGNMYFGGIGVRRDFKLANKYFSLASQSGHVLAVYHLGQMHAQGMGMMASCPTAVELFKNVAERGKWGEQLMLAYNDYKQFDDNKAFVQYAIMAQLGYEVAQSNAAFLLDRGDVTLFGGPPEDYVRALTFWSRAASQGYSPAQVKLGDYHYYGLGTPVDYETAASHYRLASEQQHNAQAMFNLGYMHEQGLGMRRDVHLAKRCYDLAAETNTDAKVPVALALFKLFLIFNLESLHDSPISIFFSMDESFISNWDIYLITALTSILGAVIYFRRPVAPQPQNQ